MKTPVIAATIVSLLLVSSEVRAQEPPSIPGPVEQHAWLKQFVGEWEYESEATMGPGQPAVKSTGTTSSRMLGSFWVISETKMDVAGMTISAVQTIGYDPERQKYIGTWVDSMMNHMWKYEGTIDPTGKILNLDAEGPNFMAAGKISKFRDSYEFKSPDLIVARSMMLGEDGQWVEFMTGQLRRRK